MKIKIEHALALLKEKSYQDFPVLFLDGINTGGLMIRPETLFLPDHYESLKKASVGEISIIYNERIYEKLCRLFPLEYRRPAETKNVIELDRIMEKIGAANNVSQRKRGILSLCEMYKRTDAGYSITVHYGERIDNIRWNQIKADINRSYGIKYSYLENGLIIFYILNPRDPDYSRKFMDFTELVSILVSDHARDARIAEDFIPEKDVYTVNDPAKLRSVYHDTNAALVIVGEDITGEYVDALRKLKNYDKYAKFMLIKKADFRNIGQILANVREEYNKQLW